MLDVAGVLESAHAWSVETKRVQVEASSSCSDLMDFVALFGDIAPLFLPKKTLDVMITLEVVQWLELLSLVRNLAVGIGGVGQSVLVAVEIQVELVLHQEWEQVHGQVVAVLVPLAEHGMVLSTDLPYHLGIVVPLGQHFLEPLVLFVSLLDGPRIDTHVRESLTGVVLE